MTPNRRRLILAASACVALTIAGGIALGQPGMQRGGGRGLIPEDRAGIPSWSNDEKYKKDVFTFCRVQYDGGGYGGRRRGGGGGGGFGGGRFSGMLQPGFDGGGFGGGRGGGFGGGGFGRGGGAWLTDFPDSDLNFSFRLQQLTSLKVNPEPVTRRLTDPDLGDFPFLYMIEPGRGGLLFSEAEVKAFRKYLLNGGFLMVDDFWGEQDYAIFYAQIKRVFPEREPQELEIDHEIFRIVYKLKEKPQVPSIHSWQGPGSTVTWETRHGGDTSKVHYQGIFDDKGRMMVIICHNTDLGDGWEREGENIDYFHEFSEKKSYPMGINIVTYAMTH